jgi:hypothetical protein
MLVQNTVARTVIIKQRKSFLFLSIGNLPCVVNGSVNEYGCVCIYGCMYISLAEFMPYMHVTNSSVHGMNTRPQNKLHIRSVRLSSIQRGVCYSSVKIISQLLQNIQIL